MREGQPLRAFRGRCPHRNRCTPIDGCPTRQAVELKSIGTIDVIGVASFASAAAVQGFPLRE